MDSKFRFNTGSQIVEIEDLGEVMNSKFLELHNGYLMNGIFNLSNFERESLKFFDKNIDNYEIHDKFFNNFTVIWGIFLTRNSFVISQKIWKTALDIAYLWEKTNSPKRIHKGTPYYFLGVSYILSGELEKGFLLMHQAVEEDKKTKSVSFSDAPAYAFVTLNYEKQNQFFRGEVQKLKRLIESKINNYCSSRGGTLNIDNFRLKFLEEKQLLDIVFYFIYLVSNLRILLEQTTPEVKENIFSSLIQANILFSLCLINDNIIKFKNKSKWKFAHHLIFLCSRAVLSLNLDKIRELNSSFTSNFQKTVSDIISSNYTFGDGSILTPIEEDLAIAYGFRNSGAHKIKSYTIIYENFEELLDRILNSLFFSIEKLY